jgi:TatD DNase family protein
LEIAKENNLYVEIHSRFAAKQTVTLLEEFDYNKIIMHWFMDSKKYIDKVAKLGYFVTVGPKYLYDQNLMDNLKDLPKEQILFETDYPANVNGQAHRPEKINDIFNKYCKDFEISKEDMQKTLDKSFKTIFPNLR